MKEMNCGLKCDWLSVGTVSVPITLCQRLRRAHAPGGGALCLWAVTGRGRLGKATGGFLVLSACSGQPGWGSGGTPSSRALAGLGWGWAREGIAVPRLRLDNVVLAPKDLSPSTHWDTYGLDSWDPWSWSWEDGVSRSLGHVGGV